MAVLPVLALKIVFSLMNSASMTGEVAAVLLVKIAWFRFKVRVVWPTAVELG